MWHLFSPNSLLHIFVGPLHISEILQQFRESLYFLNSIVVVSNDDGHHESGPGKM